MLLAAGLGTRLRPITDNIPKALVPVNGKTLLERNIKYLQKFGIFDVVVNVHHFHELMISCIQTNNGFGSRITISDESDAVLETGGGLVKAAPFFNGEADILVMNVDVITNLNLHTLISYHMDKKGLATLAVMKRESGRVLLFNPKMQLCGWRNQQTNEEKISRNDAGLEPYAFSGIQVISHHAIAGNPFSGKFSLIDLYLELAKKNELYGFDHTGDTFLDVGKPEAIRKAEAWLTTNNE